MQAVRLLLALLSASALEVGSTALAPPLVAAAPGQRATENPRDEESELARFAQDVVQSLAFARDASRALSEGQQDVKGANDTLSLSLSAMTAYRRAIANLHTAENLMTPYAKSKQEKVAKTAAMTRATYALLVDAFEGSLRVQESMVDMKPGQPLGSIVTESSKHTAQAEEAWKTLPIASSAALSHALVDTERTTAEGKLGFLLLRERERASLLEHIKLQFGDEVAAGKGAGRHYSEASAALLADFLQKPWRASDSK